MESRRVGLSDIFFAVWPLLCGSLSLPYNIVLQPGCSRTSHPALLPLSQRKVSHKLQFFFNHSSIFLQYTYVLLFVSVIRGSSFGPQICNQGWSRLGCRTKETRGWDHTGMDRSVSSGHGWNIILTTENVLLKLQSRKINIWSVETTKEKKGKKSFLHRMISRAS